MRRIWLVLRESKLSKNNQPKTSQEWLVFFIILKGVPLLIVSKFATKFTACRGDALKQTMNNLRQNLKSTIWRYYLFGFLKSFTFFSGVLVPFFTQWGGISMFQVQFLQSWFMFWIFIMEVPTGVIADKVGRKYSLALGGLTVAIATLVYGSIPRFEIFLLGEFLFGVAMAFMSGADDALLYDSLKESGRENESKKIFGRAHTFSLFGMLTSAPIGSLIASKLGLNAPMLLASIPYLLAAIVALSIREPKIREKVSESKRYLDIAKKGMAFLKNHRQLRALALDSVVLGAAAYFVIWFYQPLFTKLNLPIIYFGYLHALLAGVEMLIAGNFTFLEKIFRSGKNYLRFTALITGLVLIITGLIPSIFTGILLILLAGGFGLTRAELMSAYMNKYIPSEQRATILSSISMLRRILLVVLNPIMGFIADKSLSMAMITAGLLALAVFFFSPLKKMELEKAKS